MTVDTKRKITLYLKPETANQISSLAKHSFCGVSETYESLLEYSLANDKSGAVMSSVKHQFLMSFLIEKLGNLNRNDVFSGNLNEILINFALFSVKLNGKLGTKLSDDERVRYETDMVECLRLVAEIEPEYYDKCVKLIRSILTKKQFESLRTVYKF